MQEIDFYLVDAFSDRAFGGNAAAGWPRWKRGCRMRRC